MQFRGSNNTVTNISLGSNVTTPYVESSGATNNVFSPATGRPPLMAAPQATTPPRIGGDLRVGEQMNVDDGTWDQGPLTYAFTWLRNGTGFVDGTFTPAGLTITA